MSRISSVAVIVLALLASSVDADEAADAWNRKVAQASYGVAAAYFKGGQLAVLKQEGACWRRATPSNASDDARDCAIIILAAGVNDQWLQRQERRGPLRQMDPAVQRARFLDNCKKLGMTAADAESALAKAGGDMERIIGGLLAAHLERSQARR